MSEAEIVQAEQAPPVTGWDKSLARGEELTSLQKFAMKTNGWGTLGNLVTVGGNATAAAGIEQVATGHYITGSLMFFLGKAGGDKLDGTVARRTKTDGPKGELLDVGFDKILALGALITLPAVGVYPLEAAVPKVATQLGIMASGAKANSKEGKEMGLVLHPGKPGKLNMGVTYTSIASFMASNAEVVKQHPAVHESLFWGGGAGMTAASIVLGGMAAFSYLKQTREQTAAYEANHAQIVATQLVDGMSAPSVPQRPTPTDIHLPSSDYISLPLPPRA